MKPRFWRGADVTASGSTCAAARGGLAGGHRSGLLRGRRGGEEDLLHRGEPARRLLEAAAAFVADEDPAPLALAQEEVRIPAVGAGLRYRARGEREVAGRIVGASVEGAETAASLGDDSAVLGAAHAGVQDGLGRLVLAGGIPAAGHEETVLAHAKLQLLAALGAFLGEIRRDRELQDLARLGQRDARLARDHVGERTVPVAGKRLVELRERLLPGDLSFLDFVEALFHAGGVGGLEEVVEERDQHLDDRAPQRGRNVTALVTEGV